MQIHELNQHSKDLNEIDLVGPTGVFRNLKTAAKVAQQPGGLSAIGQRMISSQPRDYEELKRQVERNPQVATFKQRAWDDWIKSSAGLTKDTRQLTQMFNSWIDRYLLASNVRFKDLKREDLRKVVAAKQKIMQAYQQGKQPNRADFDEVIDVAFAAQHSANQPTQGAQSTNRPTSTGALTTFSDPRAEALARAAGINIANVRALARHLQQNQETVKVSTTGSASLDALLKSAGIL